MGQPHGDREGWDSTRDGVVGRAATAARRREGAGAGRFLYLECGSPINLEFASRDVTGSRRPGNRDAGSLTSDALLR